MDIDVSAPVTSAATRIGAFLDEQHPSPDAQLLYVDWLLGQVRCDLDLAATHMEDYPWTDTGLRHAAAALESAADLVVAVEDCIIELHDYGHSLDAADQRRQQLACSTVVLVESARDDLDQLLRIFDGHGDAQPADASRNDD